MLEYNTERQDRLNKQIQPYLHQEEMNTEGGKSSGQLDVFVFGVNLRGPHQAPVLPEDFLLHVSNFHEAERKELFQAGKRKTIN